MHCTPESPKAKAQSKSGVEEGEGWRQEQLPVLLILLSVPSLRFVNRLLFIFIGRIGFDGELD